MSDATLLQAVPDVVAFIRPDGFVTHHLGGRQVPFLQGIGSLAGRHLDEVLQPHVAELVGRLVRRSLASRTGCDAEFTVDGAMYQASLTAQGPKRALCIIRHIVPPAELGRSQESAESSGRIAERRGFVRRLRRSIADAALRERPLALCVVFLDGLADIGRLIDFTIRDRILTEMLRQLPEPAAAPDTVDWYLGQLDETLLGVVVDGADREQIRKIVALLTTSIARPIQIRDATFHLTAFVGCAILGEDAAKPGALIDHARAAMLEARRAGAATVQFYSDTLRMLPVARLDIERELRVAIGEGQIGVHYRARHDLASGRVAGIHAYMRWVHPLRGEIPPAEFLPIANATGLALPLSRAALERLARDLPDLRTRHGAGVPVSFGALRQHLSSGQLMKDCRQMASTSGFDFGPLEFRIAERTLATLSRPDRALGEMVEFGARLVVDEVGRGFSSLALLPRLPLAALQIDRALVVAAPHEADAQRSCRAIAALAKALGVLPVAAGIDDEASRSRMAEMGCEQGLGDLYPAVGEPESAAGRYEKRREAAAP